ncbi:DUF4406 domain-containing protein [Pseudomonas aeruginosa]|uniref:DUF4406 domain-containing protein n=4 Tax=Pseudomonas aeruginosa TaxID=287 RepID=UPI003D0226CE
MNKALVEQAGGDERAAFELFVRKHCGMPAHIAVNWDAKFTNDAWEGWKARAALEPSPVQAEQAEGAHVPDEVFAGVFAEWWEEEGQYCRAGGGDYERTFAFQAWRHLYPLLLQARAALAQPSPMRCLACGGYHGNSGLPCPNMRVTAQAQPSPAGVQLSASRERRIYIAGPMTGYKDCNFPAFNAQAEALRGLGYHVENPADHGVVDGAEWQDYLRYDISRLSTCEAIFLLPGWSKSKGAALEVYIAKALGMTFIHHADAEREQPSPVQPEEAPVIGCLCGMPMTEGHHSPDGCSSLEEFAPHLSAQAQAKQAERPEVVARVVHSNPVVLGQCGPLNANDELMTVAQHAASVARWAEMFNRVEQQRDAALARVAELEAKLSDPTAVHQWQFSNAWFDCSEEALLKAGKEGSPFRTLYAGPVAQAQQLHDLDKQCRDDVARALGLRPNQERGFAWSYLLASIKSCVKASGDSAQAQHSVPEEFIGRLSEFLAQRGATGKALLRELRTVLAAAPGKEGV